MTKEIEFKSVEEAQTKLNELRVDSSLNKPTEKEINEATKDFNAKAAAFNGKTFKIGTPKKADAVYDFVLEFLEKHVYWTKNGWMGVLKMHEELTESRKNKKEKDSFQVGYQALEFLFYALTNPGGTGIASAQAIEKLADIYIETMELASEKLEIARKELADVQFLQEKVTAMQQGFYLEREDSVMEPQSFASPTAEEILKKKDI